MEPPTWTRERAFARAVAAAFVCLAIVQFVLQCSLLANGVDYVASLLTNDDTYYYLQTAWQTKLSGFVTFDGINETNGVQLLWFWIVYLLSLAAKTKVGLLFASLVTCFALNVLCYVPIWKLTRLTGRPALALLLGGLWAKLVTDGTYWLGLENSLHAFIFWCIVWQAAVFFRRLSEGRPASILPLTGLLVLNAWTRMDSAVLSATVYVACVGALLQARRRAAGPYNDAARQIAGSALLAVAGLAVALGAFTSMGGGPLPVSALIKLSGAAGLTGLLTKAGEMFALSLPAFLPHGLASPAIKAALGAASAAVVALALGRRGRPPDSLRALRSVWLALAAGLVLYLVAAGLLGAQSHSYFVWHRSPFHVFWTVTVGVAVSVVLSAVARFLHVVGRPQHVVGRRQFLADRPPHVADRSPRGVHRALSLGARVTGREGNSVTVIGAGRTTRYGAVVIGAALMVFSVARMLTPPRVDPTSMLAIRYRAALWMGDNLPLDSTCAAWNAGQLGFYAPQAVINLDGLVNSIQYYENVLHGRRRLQDYLEDNNVRYIVDYVENELTAGLEVIRSFPAEADGRVLRVWRLPWPGFEIRTAARRFNLREAPSCSGAVLSYPPKFSAAPRPKEITL